MLDLNLSRELLNTVDTTSGSVSPARSAIYFQRWRELCELALTRIYTLELQIDELVAEVYALTEAKTTEQRTANSFHRQLVNSREEFSVIAEENSTLQKNARNVADAEARATTATRENKLLKGELDGVWKKLQERSVDVTTANAKATTATRDNTLLKADLVDLRTRMDKESQEVKDVHAYFGAAARENQMCKERLRLMREELKQITLDANPEKLRTTVENRKLEADLERSQSEITWFRESRKRHGTEMAAMKKQLLDAEKRTKATETKPELDSLRKRFTAVQKELDILKRQTRSPPQINDLKRRLTDAEKARDMWKSRADARGGTEEGSRADPFARKVAQNERAVAGELKGLLDKAKVACEKRRAWCFQLRVAINNIFEQEPEMTRLAVHGIVDEMASEDAAAGKPVSGSRKSI